MIRFINLLEVVKSMSDSTRIIRLCVLLVMIVMVAGCVKPATLKYQERMGDVKTVDQSKKTDEVTVPDQPENPDDSTEQKSEESSTEKSQESTSETSGELKAKDLLKQEGVARVRTIGESSEIDATFFGRNEVFTVPYTDKDAIIFDIAQKFGITLQEVRIAVSFDGQVYLREDQKEVAELEVKGQESIFNESESNPYADLEYTFTKDDGFLRGIACDLENKVIKYKLTNFKDEPVNRYKNVKPKIQNPLTVYFNKKRLEESFCGGIWTMEPGETIECYHAGVEFVRSPQSGSVYDSIEYNTDLVDEFVLTQPGYNEHFTFVCTPESSQNSNQTTG